ncbi:MAG TPA: hypothetical protein VHX52_04920, partial [Steroidobacteraceae bacterium]|nr:hypothetical protein [Steroidobacteraceae bacterium]
ARGGSDAYSLDFDQQLAPADIGPQEQRGRGGAYLLAQRLLDRALVGAANEQAGGARYGAERLLYKVYVRRPGDQPRIEQTLRRELGPIPPLLFLQADICRRELLVEIEAVGT